MLLPLMAAITGRRLHTAESQKVVVAVMVVVEVAG